MIESVKGSTQSEWKGVRLRESRNLEGGRSQS